MTPGDMDRAADSPREPVKLGVLVSGAGSNLQAILDAINARTLDAVVTVVVSNKPGVLALERARKANVRAVTIPHKDFGSREEFDRAVVVALQNAGVEWVVLAGFMRIFTSEFLRVFEGRIVNIHPALLPAFPGVNSIQQALDYGVKVTGCTVHYVDQGVDTGKIIAQRAVAIEPGDTFYSLAPRMHAAEHELFVSVLRDIAAGRVLPLVKPKTGG